MCTIQNPSLINNSVEISTGCCDLSGGICSQDGSKTWMFNEDNLYCVSMKNGNVGTWKCNFGKICCVKEVICKRKNFLLVGTSSEIDSSILVILYASSLRVVKSVYFAEKISCFHSFMFPFNGIESVFLAVGCYGGRTYWINLDFDHSAIHQPLAVRIIDDESSFLVRSSTTEDLDALLLVQGMVLILGCLILL